MQTKFTIRFAATSTKPEREKTFPVSFDRSQKSYGWSLTTLSLTQQLTAHFKTRAASEYYADSHLPDGTLYVIGRRARAVRRYTVTGEVQS